MIADASHRRRTLWLTGTLHAFTHVYQVALLPLYLRIQQDLKLASVEQATLLVTVMGAAYYIPSYPLGVLADRLSRKRLLAIGLVLNGLGFVSLAFSPNYAMALASVVLAGFGGSFFHPAATALIARLFPDGRGRALGLVGIGASVGFFLGPIYCGWRAVMCGNWRVPVCELGLLGVIFAGVFAWLADEERGVHAASSDKGSEAQSEQTTVFTASMLKRRGAVAPQEKLFPTATLWIFFFAASLAFSLRDFAGGAMSTATSLFLQNARGFNPSSTGLALSGIFIASAISNPLFGRMSDGGRKRWIAGVLLIAAALIAIFPRMPVGAMLPVLLTYGFFFLSSYPITEAALMESVPDAVRGRIFGLFITVSGFVSNLAHWLIGNWVHKLGTRAMQAESYLPLYGTLSLLVIASLSGLPCLHAIRRREHLEPLPAPGLETPKAP